MRANVMRKSLFEVFWMDCLAHDCTAGFGRLNSIILPFGAYTRSLGRGLALLKNGLPSILALAKWRTGCAPLAYINATPCASRAGILMGSL